MISVLIIDDNNLNHFVASAILKHLGIAREIKSFMNGMEAATYFDSLKSGYPDLVLLDINMPLMNGFDFLDWYEQKGFMGFTKIAMCTSSEDQRDKDKAFTYMDVVGYIDKPINQEKLVNVLNRIK